MSVTRIAAALALFLAACTTVDSDPGANLGDAGDESSAMCDVGDFGEPPELTAAEQSECEQIVSRTPSIDDVADAIADACADSDDPGTCAQETAAAYPHDCSGLTDECEESIGKVLSFMGIDASECMASGADFPESCRWCRAEERIAGNQWRCG